MAKHYKGKNDIDYKKFHKKNKLSQQTHEFIYWYCINNNAYKSCVLSGWGEDYSYKKSKDLLNDERVITRIKERKQKMMMEQGLIPDDIIRKHIDIAFADIGNYINVNNHFLEFKNPKNLDYSLVKKISNDKKGISIELEDKSKSLQWLAEYFGVDPKHKLNIKKLDQENKIEELEKMVNSIVESKKYEKGR